MPALLKITETDPMRREMNNGLMVAWINADLTNRAWGDVNKSIVFYDKDYLFVGAAAEMPPPAVLDLIYAGGGVRAWSKGIV